MYPKLRINGVDVTNSWKHEQSSVKSVLTKAIDTALLIIEDTTGSISVNEQHEVILSNNAETVRYFAGYVATKQITLEGITRIFKLTCQDYTILLDSAIANKVYTSETCAAIINDAFTDHLSEIDSTTYVETGETIDRLVVNRWTLRELLDYLANLSGFDWYVDYNKKLHFFARETNVAPFGLSDSPDNAATYPFRMWSYRKDATKLINRVVIRGGTYLSDDQDFDKIPANGTEVNILLPYKMFAPDGETNILVWKNTGDDGAPIWTAQTVGIDGMDTGKDVLHNQSEKLLIFTVAPSNLNKAIKVHAKFERSILIRVRSDSSKTEYGRWFDGKVTDKDINSIALAKLRGKAMLAQSAFAKEQGVAELTQDGLIAGMCIPITDSLRSVAANYLIRSVTIRFLGNQIAKYMVEFGEYNPDLIDLLLELKRKTAPYMEIREDEILHELLELGEGIGFENSANSSVAKTTEDYTWGVSESGGDLVWSFGTWA